MIVTGNQDRKKRIVTAPSSSLLSNNATNIPSIVISVEVVEDESVEWIWTVYPDGQKVVTGYNIIKNN